MISLIVAHTPSLIIGRSDTNSLPWPRLRADMRRFRSVTLGKRVVLGRRTWESLPRRPLPGRRAIVLSRDLDYTPLDNDGKPADGVMVSRWGEDQLGWAAEFEEEYVVCGGAAIYEQALPFASKVYRTVIRQEFDGDIRFADPLGGNEWDCESEGRAVDGGVAMEFQVLTRREG